MLSVRIKISLALKRELSFIFEFIGEGKSLPIENLYVRAISWFIASKKYDQHFIQKPQARISIHYTQFVFIYWSFMTRKLRPTSLCLSLLEGLPSPTKTTTFPNPKHNFSKYFFENKNRKIVYVMLFPQFLHLHLIVFELCVL